MADAKKGGKDDKRPIIKKIKKVQGGGHHGGAWKVAYADFVTAMMAFFLLLWLLSTSSKATLEGIAEFFTPTIGVTGAQGIGFKGGASATIGTAKSDTSTPSVIVGQNPSGSVSQAPETQAPTESDKEDNLFKQGADAIKQMVTQDPEMQQYNENITVEQTPEGLKVDLMDSDKYAIFQSATANLTQHGQKILARMTNIIKRMPNYVSITGHTDASPTEAGNADYSNWELSADRANSTRRFLLKSGMEPERPKKVVGMGDKELLLPSQPRNPKNRRVSLIMLKGSHILLPDDLKQAPQDLLSAPEMPIKE
jgi:chemotaxis protein MotB